MASKKITDLEVATALTGEELLEASQLSDTVLITAATISAVAAGNSFNDSGSGFITAGFAVGDRVNVKGFTGTAANNIFVGVVTALVAGSMEIGGVDGDVIVDEAAGDTVTITKWVSRRIQLDGVVPPGGTAAQALLKLSASDYDFDWGDVAASGGGSAAARIVTDRTLVDSAVASASASVDLSVVSADYDEWVLVGRDVVLSNAGAELGLQTGTGGVPTFDAANNYDFAIRWRFGTTGVGTLSSAFVSATSSLRLGTVSSASNAAGVRLDFDAFLKGLVSGSNMKLNQGHSDYDGGGGLTSVLFAGVHLNAAYDVSALRILPSAGTITSGEFFLYGLKHDAGSPGGGVLITNGALFVDEKPNGTSGGTSVGFTGAYAQRDLNTVRFNDISGASLSTNQVTLPAGTYRFEASVPCHQGDFFKSRLYNVTDAAVIAVGSSERSRSATASDGSERSVIAGQFTITSTKVIELQFQAQTGIVNGLGAAVSFGDVEVYSELFIEKVSPNGAEVFVLACSDETTALTVGTGKVTFRMPYGFTLTDVRASVTTAPTGAALSIDINEGGVSILSTALTIDATEKTSTTAAIPAVVSDPDLADDAEITIDVDQIGSTIAGAGLKVMLIGTRA